MGGPRTQGVGGPLAEQAVAYNLCHRRTILSGFALAGC